MKNNGFLKCFDDNMSIEDVQKNLEKICSKVKFKYNRFHVKHDKTEYLLFKKNDGYYATVKMPIWLVVLIVIFFVVFFGVVFAFVDVAIGAIPAGIIGSLIGFGCGRIYSSSKKEALERFCEEARSTSNE